MPFLLTLTQAGLAAIVNAQAGTVGPVTISQIGLTDAAFTVSSTLEALPGEIKRLPVSGDVLGDDVIHVEALDTSADAYEYRGFALYSSTGLLFAVYGQADPIAQKAGGSATFIVVDVAVTTGQASAITFGDTNFTNPPASTDAQGVVELATVDEAKAGADALRVITPATAKAAVLSWLGFTPMDVAAFTKNAVLGLLGYVPFDSAGFTGAAVRAALGFTPLDAAAFTKNAVLGLLGFTPQDAAAFAVGSNAHGDWEKRPGGMLDQRGYVAIPSGGNTVSGTLTFPQTFDFTDADSIVITANVTGKPNGVWGAATIVITPIDGNTAVWQADTANQSQTFGGGIRFAWRATGKAAA